MHPGGQEKAPRRAREGTQEGKRRHPGGQEKAPGRARESTQEGKIRHPGGQEKAPRRAREGTQEGKRRHPGGQEKTGPPAINQARQHTRTDTSIPTDPATHIRGPATLTRNCEWHGQGMKVKLRD